MTKRTRPILTAVLLCGLLLASTTATSGSATYDLSWWTVDGGGGTLAAAGKYSLASTTGQPDAGELAGSVY